MRLTTKRSGPDGWPWVVCQEDGGMLAACPDESTAERVAFLLGSWKGGAAAPRVLVEAGKRVPYGAERPAAADVREVVPSGSTREDAPAAAPGGFPAGWGPENEDRDGAPLAPRVDAAGGDGWSAGGARVYPRVGGGFCVAFERRPALHVRQELKAGGFRWNPARGEWSGVRLPARFLPVRSRS